MSLVAFKRKSMIQYGGQRSGKPPGGFWMMRGPFGKNNTVVDEYGPEGFSINGGRRSKGYIGRDCKFSSNGTPFRGTEPLGCGGAAGNYAQPQPVLNAGAAIVDIRGNQYKFVKPSVLSTSGMIATKYRWIRGVYPNVWVQPLYTGNQSDSGSQGLYIHTKAAANMCASDINNPEKYAGFIVNHGPTLCRTSAAKFTYNQMASNGPYTKNLGVAMTSSEQTLKIQRRCANPTAAQKPFPYRVQTGVSLGAAGTRVSTGGNGCGTSDIVLTPQTQSGR